MTVPSRRDSTAATRAIITDDSWATRMILRRLLEHLRFEVEEATDGNALLDTLESDDPDECLIDWNMPGLDGTEVIQATQSHPEWCDIPSILVTDETYEARIESALDAGATYDLAKPFRSETLRETLVSMGLAIRRARGRPRPGPCALLTCAHDADCEAPLEP